MRGILKQWYFEKIKENTLSPVSTDWGKSFSCVLLRLSSQTSNQDLLIFKKEQPQEWNLGPMLIKCKLCKIFYYYLIPNLVFWVIYISYWTWTNFLGQYYGSLCIFVFSEKRNHLYKKYPFDKSFQWLSCTLIGA